MKKIEIVIVGIVVMILSFPLMYIAMLLGTGSAKLVFKGDLAKRIEIENQARLEREFKNRDSLIVAKSYAYNANVEELERIKTEKEALLQEQERIKLMQNELQQERDSLELERKRFEKAVANNNELNEKRLKKLARVYGAMKAVEAARIMGTLDDSLDIEIFKFMSEDRQKAKILAAMDGAKAARLSEKMGIKIK